MADDMALPWRTDDPYPDVVTDSNDEEVASFSSNDDCEFAVKAVNSHAPLVKALTDALCELSHCADQLGAREENSVRRAIAEARRLLTAVGSTK